jgi:hypothetical protein
MKVISIIIGLMIFSMTYGQNSTIRPLNELINTIDPGWPLVKSWIEKATNKVEVLPKDNKRADSSLFQTQVTTRSPMGAVIYETGGILIDNGWIRILGSGSPRLDRSLIEWNKGKSYTKTGEKPSFLLIADDVLGGFFAINAGGLSTDKIGKVFYFTPDNLSWESLDLGYSYFLTFCFNGDLKKFYEGFRWTDWEKDMPTITGNQGVSCYPFLWTKEGKDINKVNRRFIQIEELWGLYLEYKEKK